MKDKKTLLAKNINYALPMIEEITKAKYLPACVIGFSVNKKEKRVNSLFSTLDDSHDAIIYQICKSFVSEYAEKYEPKQP